MSQDIPRQSETKTFNNYGEAALYLKNAYNSVKNNCIPSAEITCIIANKFFHRLPYSQEVTWMFNQPHVTNESQVTITYSSKLITSEDMDLFKNAVESAGISGLIEGQVDLTRFNGEEIPADLADTVIAMDLIPNGIYLPRSL